jgi:hypothetical protein
MTNYYVKKIESTNEASAVNTGTSAANGGSVLKTNSEVGIFKRSGTNFYKNGVLDSSKGTVLPQSGSNFMPTKNNLTSLISNAKVKSVFNKFFNGNNSGTGTNFSNWESASNLNAFAYMKSNGVEGNKFTAY